MQRSTPEREAAIERYRASPLVVAAQADPGLRRKVLGLHALIEMPTNQGGYAWGVRSWEGW